MSYLLLIISVLLVTLNTMTTSFTTTTCAILKIIFPWRSSRLFLSRMANNSMWRWATLNHFMLQKFNNVNWNIDNQTNLKKDGWYLMLSNHLSWADIVILCSVFKDTIPMPKFFLKQQLLYVPFVGLACWGLDMPFMKRLSRKQVVKNPKKRFSDMQAIRKSCEKFRDLPTTVVNYAEGTRFTEQKKSQTRSPYQHLLQAKTGGLNYALQAMGDQFDQIIDVTIAYPENIETPFRDLLMGKLTRIDVHVRILDLDEKLLSIQTNDSNARANLRERLNEIWQEKDERLTIIYND
ncbi:acyltransferase, partial [Psychromonas sp.]|nr:acyltransferase [Psychromonas sp.]